MTDFHLATGNVKVYNYCWLQVDYKVHGSISWPL